VPARSPIATAPAASASPASAVAAPVAPSAVVEVSPSNGVAAAPPPPSEGWRRTRTTLEQKRPRLAALLANASVLQMEAGAITLGFVDRADVDAAEKQRGDIEQALATEFGGPVRLHVKQDGGAKNVAVMRAEIVEEADALALDKRKREQEARQHPMIQKAQDLFGAAIREIKT
jgi:hypothetical protein